MRQANFPGEIIVNPADKQLFVTPEVDAAFPGAVEAFSQVDHAFASDREAFLKDLEQSQFSFQSSTGAQIDCSLIPGKGEEVLIIWAPFSDSKPTSDAEAIYRYIDNEEVSKSEGAPNSWSQTTKSGVTAELLKAVDREMTVLTIFSPLPGNAYTSEENKKLKLGNFTPAERITSEALKHAQDRIHGPVSETQFDKYHLSGGSLGASSAIGSAVGLMLNGRGLVLSTTAQELIVARRNLASLASRFTVRGSEGEPSKIQTDDFWPVIEEPLVRKQIDSRGNELQMVKRMLQGMTKFSRLKGLTHPDRNQTPRQIETLTMAGVSVVVPLAENSGLTYDTELYLPGTGEHVIKVRATKGERTTHLIDEHVGLTALAATMNVLNSRP